MPNRIKYIFQKLHIWSSYLLFFMLPFPDRFLPISIVLWLVSWLLMRILSKEVKIVTLNNQQKIGVILFLLWIVWSFISGLVVKKQPGAILIERRLLLFFVPLIALIGESVRIDKIKISKALMFGVVVSIIIYTLPLFINFQRLDISTLLFRQNLTRSKHHAYFSLTAVIAFYLFVTNKQKFKSSDIVFGLITYLMIMLYIFLVRSRMGMLNMILMTSLLLYFFYNLYEVKNKVILASILLTAIAIVAIIENPKFNEIKIGNINETHLSRPILWKSSLELIVEKPIFGYGLNAGSELLIEKSYQNGLKEARKRKQNAHNQFLQMCIDNGIFGLLLFIFAIVFIVKGAANKNNSFSVFLFIAFAFLTESMLQRIAGVAILGVVIYFVILPKDTHKDFKERYMDNIIYVMSSFLLVLLFSSYLVLCLRKDRGYNPMNPRTYAESNFKLVKELPGELPRDLFGVWGYRLDNKATPYPRDDSFSLTRIAKVEANECDSVFMSVYCYVSDDFSGEAFIAASGKAYGKSVYCDLKQRKTWQYLSFVAPSPSNAKSALGLYISNDEKSIEGLKGYVIFALPKYLFLRNGEETRSVNVD